MANKIGSTGILCCFALAVSSFACDLEHICGDGVVDPDETCDDGNEIDGDACSSACQLEPMCGDGTLDAEEACDDGNTTNGDGCSATCEFDDLASTPGDDRAGYLTCSADGATFTCGPGTVCCGIGTSGCASSGDECSVPIGVSECDGPEDCAAGEHCWTSPKFTYCSEQTLREPWLKCHTDADCPDAWENPCNGGCYGDLRTDDEVTGDVRPGFVECGAPESGDTVSCGPGTGCCTSGIFECSDDIEQCRGDYSPSIDMCDGPEDCAGPGEQCWVDSEGSRCKIAEPSLFIVRCHVHDDCIQSFRNPCRGGRCVGTEAALGP